VGDPVIETDPVTQGYFSLLRWRADATRDEARNVAVLLVTADGDQSDLRHAPVSRISPRLSEQGLLDEVLLGLKERLSPETEGGPADLAVLEELHRRFGQSLVVTEPQRVAVNTFEDALTTLFRAYVSPPKTVWPKALSKGAVLDRVVAAFRGQGLTARRSSYVGDFIFDVIVENGSGTSVVEVLSFAGPRQDWTPTEREVGHFLYAARRLEIPGKAVVQPPAEEDSPNEGRDTSYRRVTNWFRDENVPVLHPDELVGQQVMKFTDN
jgi:hypothetical protein